MGDKIIPANVFIHLFPRANRTIHSFLNLLLPMYDLTNINRVASYLAQCAHESGHFSVFYENLNYSASRLLEIFPRYFDYTTAVLYERNPEAIANLVYANRMGNGPESSGDGWKFRGRGVIQLTGKENYEKFADFKGISLDECSDYMDSLQGQIESSFWYWDSRGLNRHADNEDIVSVTRRINGGLNGLSDRESLFYKIKESLIDVIGTGDDIAILSVHNKPPIKVSKDVYRHEFECSPQFCGCGLDFVDYALVNVLQRLKETLKREIKIISATRCEKYNTAVKGIPSSQHLLGKALDFEVPEVKDENKPFMKSSDILNLIKNLFGSTVYTYAIDDKTVHVDVRSSAKSNKTVKIVGDVTREDFGYVYNNKYVDTIDIAMIIVLKAFYKVVKRNFKLLHPKYDESMKKDNALEISKAFDIEVPEDRKKRLPEMKSSEMDKIFKQLFGNLIWTHMINEKLLHVDIRHI